MTRALQMGLETVIPKCRIANDFFSRFLGLMGRKTLASDEAVFFPRCNSIHTFFMRFRIDVILLSPEGVVVEILESMRPWRMMMPRRDVKHVIEVRGGLSRELGITAGKKLRCEGILN